MLGWGQALAGWEAGGYILWRPSGVAVGVGASGLVGSLVVYGEAWSIADEQGLRYSLGATGYAGDLLWTAELARTPFLPEAPAGVPAPPVPLVAVQLAYPLAPDWFLVVDGRTALDGVGPAGGGPASDGPGSGGSASTGLASGGIEADPGRAHLLSVTLTHEVLPGQLELELGARHGILPPRPAALDMSATARWYF